MTGLNQLHEEWLADLAYRQAFDDLEGEFALAQAIAQARNSAGLTQADVPLLWP